MSSRPMRVDRKRNPAEYMRLYRQRKRESKLSAPHTDITTKKMTSLSSLRKPDWDNGQLRSTMSNQPEKIVHPKRIRAAYMRQYRQKKREFDQHCTKTRRKVTAAPSSNAERCKRYRQRLNDRLEISSDIQIRC